MLIAERAVRARRNTEGLSLDRSETSDPKGLSSETMSEKWTAHDELKVGTDKFKILPYPPPLATLQR